MSVGGFRNKMKKLILISALLFSFNSWADDEFPIEITCSFGEGGIIQFHLTKELFEIKSRRRKLDSNSWWRIPKESTPDVNFFLFNQEWSAGGFGQPKLSKAEEKAKPYLDKKIYSIGDYKYFLSINKTAIRFNFKSPLVKNIKGSNLNFGSQVIIIRNTGRIGILTLGPYSRESTIEGTCKKGLKIPERTFFEKDNLF